jgi:hypothetical protein
LAKNSSVKISVYDLLGKEVMEVVNENQTAGEHQRTLNTENFQNGIYFVKMNVNGICQTQKLIISK